MLVCTPEQFSVVITSGRTFRGIRNFHGVDRDFYSLRQLKLLYMIKCAGAAKQETGAKHKDNRLQSYLLEQATAGSVIFMLSLGKKYELYL